MRDRLGDKVRLQHILDAIEAIENNTKGVSANDFVKQPMMYDATVRQLEIIGEASNRLSESILTKNSSIPWAKIIGLRNMLIHEYFGIDDLMIWNVVNMNLPRLKIQIARILNAMD
jgi:uncharacterized protein with HEPN domain